MRAIPFFFGIVLSVVAAVSAHAETFGTPQALLKALYAYDTSQSDPEAPSLYSAYFSDALNARFKADLDRTPEGEAGAIAFDPVIAGEDGEAEQVEIGEPLILDDTAEVEVQFTNGAPVTLFYSLVKEHGGWKVDDIADQQGETPWSLSALFDAAGE